MADKIKCSVIIVAAGKGERMNTEVKKQYIKLHNKPILAYTIEKFENNNEIDDIILVTGKNDIKYCKEEIVEKYKFNKVKKIIEGGNERQYSVFNGLKEISKNTDIVLIHDGVRPFVSNDDIYNIIYNAHKYDGCILGVKVKDTVKVCDENNFITNTPDRRFIYLAQTPQAFKYDLILKAYESLINSKCILTDDSMILEKIGYKIKIIEGSYTNIKITTPDDLYFGEAILKQLVF